MVLLNDRECERIFIFFIYFYVEGIKKIGGVRECCNTYVVVVSIVVSVEFVR